MVDVLLASYNGEKYIKEQIKSILNQSYKDINLIISDDLSSDSTVDIILEMSKTDNRITLFVQKNNLGYVKNFEFLMSRVQSDYFMLCDQDDVWIREKIAISLEKIGATKALLVYSDLLVVDKNLTVINSSFWKSNNLYNKISKYNTYEMLILSNCVTGCTIMAKKELINISQPFPENKLVIHDYWLALMAMQNKAIEYIDTPLIKYRQHENNEIGAGIKKEIFSTFKEKRDSFIDAKIEQINIYIENEHKFTHNAQNLNISFLEFLKAKQNTKYISLSRLSTFFKVYKCESLKTKLGNFLMYNIPMIYKVIYRFFN